MKSLKVDIEDIDFHDSGLEDFHVSFSKETVYILVGTEEEDVNLSITFNEISDLEIGELTELDNLYDVEINNADFSSANGKKHADFLMLLGFSKPSWSVSFSYKTVDIKEVSVGL